MKNGKMIAQVFVQDGWDYNFDDGTSTDKSGYGSVDGHDYVEIGGVKWATMNVGATTVAGDMMTCCGDYFMWGQTKPYYTGITRVDDQHSVLENANFEERKALQAPSDGRALPLFDEDLLDDAHDAATANWGKKWRTPTNDEFKALAKACCGNETPHFLSRVYGKISAGGIYFLTKDQTDIPEYSGVPGVLFVARDDISKRVFFPAAGNSSGYGSSWVQIFYLDYKYYQFGCYWFASAFHRDRLNYGYGKMKFTSEYWIQGDYGQDWQTLNPIRPVAK